MFRRSIAPWLMGAVLLGCNVPEPPGSTGGAGPHGIVVVESDYQSTNVSAVSADGGVLSESILSSGSAAPGISAALSGDVVVPSGADPSGHIVLVDSKNAVITAVDPVSASVQSQISVATGFDAYPHDYREVSPGKAYVSRYATNTKPGSAPFDQGGDLLVIDTHARAITGRIDLASDDDAPMLPRPDRMLVVGDEVWVSLQRLSADYQTGKNARIAGVSAATDQIAWKLDLPGVANCGGPVLAPSGRLAAIACHGVYTDPDPSRSAVILIDPAPRPPVVTRRIDVGGAVWPSIVFVTDTLMLCSIPGSLAAPARADRAFTLDIASGTVTSLFDAQGAFVLGDVVCAQGRCYMADAALGVVHAFRIEGAGLSADSDLLPDPSIGLPPRGLGLF
jgi:hypothetical protein